MSHLFSVCTNKERMFEKLLTRPSLGWIFVQAFLYKVLELSRPFGINGRWVFLDDIIEHTSVMLCDIGWLTLCKLDCENTKRPDIYFVRILFVFFGFNQLWCHPADSTYFTCSCLLLLSKHNSITKVSQFDFTIVLTQNVV